jgi:hypothetical protein
LVGQETNRATVDPPLMGMICTFAKFGQSLSRLRSQSSNVSKTYRRNSPCFQMTVIENIIF